jgi:NTP pyrophosphatase (non-canonical NTP hydrolase)
MLAVHLSINQFMKTQEGMALVQQQVPFVMNGTVWQGYKGIPATVAEKQLTDEEFAALVEVDDTKEKVAFVRKQRLGSRNSRKSQEYSDRLGKLMTERNEVLEAIEREERSDRPVPAHFTRRLAYIDERMDRMAQLSNVYEMASGDVVAPTEAEENTVTAKLDKYRIEIPGFDPAAFPSPEEALKAAEATFGVDGEPRVEPETPEPPQYLRTEEENAAYACPTCQKQPDRNHKSPKKWLVGHSNAHKYPLHKNKKAS